MIVMTACFSVLDGSAKYIFKELPLWLMIFPILSALFYATILITTRTLGQKDNAVTTLFYTSVGSLFLSTCGCFGTSITVKVPLHTRHSFFLTHRGASL